VTAALPLLDRSLLGWLQKMGARKTERLGTTAKQKQQDHPTRATDRRQHVLMLCAICLHSSLL
jgi:hypothetical protein